MKFELTCEIQPAANFGLPQDGVVVLPGRSGPFYGPTVHTKALLRVGHGSLPEYRKDSEAIDVDVNLGKSKGKLKDNFIKLEIESDDPGIAYQIVSQ